MSYNQALYQKIILDHNRSPRNFKKLEAPTHTCPGNNPMCGDHLTVYLTCKDNIIIDISFDGEGCALSKASASIMTETIMGKSMDEAKQLYNKLNEMLTQNKNEELLQELGDLSVFEKIKSTSSRIKCVTLAWRTLVGAINLEGETTTE